MQAAHAFPMPENSKEFYITRRYILRLTLLSVAPFIALCLFFLLAAPMASLAWRYGVAVLAYPEAWLVGAHSVRWWAFLLVLFVFSFACLRVGRLKLADLPVRYGFDREALYCSSAYGYEQMRWELFSGWFEYKDAFIVKDGVRRMLIPKEQWTAEELREIRELLQAKAKKSIFL